MGIRIKGTGRYVPEKILTNADLEKMVDTSDEWIVTRTGIKERHLARAEETTSDMAAAAANLIFANAASVIGWGNLILVWLGLMVIGVLLMIPYRRLFKKTA